MNVRSKLIIGVSVFTTLLAMFVMFLSGVYWQRSEHAFFRRYGGWLPIAHVGGEYVVYRDYLVHVDAQRAFLAGPLAVEAGAVQDVTDKERKEAYERAIRIQAVESLAKDANQEVTPLDIDRAYQELIARAGVSTTKAEIESFLQAQFGWDEGEYKEHLLRPALTEEILRTKDESGFEQALQTRVDEAKRYLRF